MYQLMEDREVERVRVDVWFIYFVQKWVVLKQVPQIVNPQLCGLTNPVLVIRGFAISDSIFCVNESFRKYIIFF